MPETMPFFLIAMPQLNDKNFEKSVVLMLTHNTEGALGLILNRPADMTIKEFSHYQNLDCHPSLQHTPMLVGGPLEKNRCWVLHANASLAEKQEVLPDVFLSGGLESLQTLLTEGAKPLKIMIGYAGWAPGQLEFEMAQGAWLSCPIRSEHLFQTEPIYLWDEVLKTMGISPHNLIMTHGVH